MVVVVVVVVLNTSMLMLGCSMSSAQRKLSPVVSC
jgi:hypothetical protein